MNKNIKLYLINREETKTSMENSPLEYVWIFIMLFVPYCASWTLSKKEN